MQVALFGSDTGVGVPETPKYQHDYAKGCGEQTSLWPGALCAQQIAEHGLILVE
jgi:hypothetical protein